ncbi:DUF2975 domain-containing protein [Saccharospirillum salsuginis]|uniref:DUF2975 domain-containing protein n=1 Tax=Saccharospirillum salsuginis TaxID=418750 RepID=A0A918K0S3_9GAMM|nr:DUF2975 domain-containing protein [Saccharospirillum salsuginis]GGX42833.1 hypothetical protein GCM10007392_06800 [Saccharospirillum salsuginis]
MNARRLHWILTVVWGGAGLLLAVAGIILLAAPMLGEPLVTQWPLVAEVSRFDVPMRIEAPVSDAVLAFTRGTLTVEHTGYGLSWLLRLSDVIVSGGLILSGLWLLRAFTREVRDGMPFSPGSARRLRWIGVLLLAFPIWQVIRDLLWHRVVLSQVTPIDGETHLVLPWNQAGMYDLRLVLDPDLGFAVTGVLMLVVAEAFRIGMVLREDSEEII